MHKEFEISIGIKSFLSINKKPGGYLFLILFLIQFIVNAQQGLWGLTNLGGAGGGTLFTTDRNGDNEQVKYNFPQTAGGTNPIGGLITAANGKIYGTTQYGGHYGSASTGGTLFEFDPNDLSISIKVSFGDPRDVSGDGSIPMGALMQAANGKLYGTTSQANSYLGGGTIFEYDPASGTYQKLWTFSNVLDVTDTLGSIPIGSLLQATNGKLYGNTSAGASNTPSFFEFDPVTQTMTQIYSCGNGCGGFAGSYDFVQAGNGKIYGMTTKPGTGLGMVFSYDPTTVNVNFIAYVQQGGGLGWDDGESFTIGPNGKLYTNMNSDNNSHHYISLGEFDPATNTYSDLVFFDTTDVKRFLQHLLLGNDNKLYGTSSGGGAFDKGVLFSYDPINKIYQKLHDFDGVNGAAPWGFITQAPNGKIYGTTLNGGIEDKGSLFEYDPATKNFQKVYDFIIEPQSTSPQSSLVLIADSMLYGTSLNGGAYEQGTLFSYAPFSDTFTNIFDFNTTVTGGNPIGSLIQATDGKLYGMTSTGGGSNFGTLYAFNTVTQGFTKQYDFTATDGTNPSGALLQAPDGLLYGVTSQGGSLGMGTLFAFNITTSGYTKKTDLDSINQGSHPQGSLEWANNKLYGLASSGGSVGFGALFSYDPAGNTFTKIINLNTITGANPEGSLLLANNGLLYGLTSKGGANNAGTLFSFNPFDNSFSKKLDFSTLTGANPRGSLWQSTNGKLYGMTGTGGTYNLGTLFEYDPIKDTLTKKFDFDWDNGASPVYGNLVEVCLAPRITTQPQGLITCSKAAFQLNITATGLPTYQWYANNQSITGANNATLTVTSATQGNTFYACKIFNACGTITSNIVTVTGNPLPVLDAGPNQSVCVGQQVTFAGVGPFLNSWSGGVSNNTVITASVPGITVYTFTGLDGNLCRNTALLTITVNNFPSITIAGNQKICSGSSSTLIASGAYVYSWSTGSADSVITVLPSNLTTYIVTGTGISGCARTAIVTVTVNSLPVASLDLTSISGLCNTVGSVALTGGKPQGGTYWYSENSVTGLDISKGGEYIISYRYTDQNSCFNEAKDTLSIKTCLTICEMPDAPCYCTNTCPPRFKVYTGLTPNGDGQNDVFYIDSLTADNEVTILDKWGNEVYHKTNYTNNWDGKQNGKELPAGVYYYMIESDRKRFSGTVNIIR